MRAPLPRWVATFAAGTVPLAVFVGTSSGVAHWLDTGEFVAVASDLGISHPPGHPLAGLTLSFARILPLGPLAFRVALVCALAAATAAALMQRAGRHVLDALGLRETTSDVLALGATLFTVLTYSWWFQGVRPEVYALEAALSALILERAVYIESRFPLRDTHAVRVAAVAFGLALTTHHFLALLLLPALAPTMARVVLARGARPLAQAAALVAAGLMLYLYLPIRAARDPLLTLGDPTSPGRFYWVVSAAAFQGNQGDGVPLPLGERFADVIMQLLLDLHPRGSVRRYWGSTCSRVSPRRVGWACCWGWSRWCSWRDAPGSASCGTTPTRSATCCPRSWRSGCWARPGWESSSG
ncbi:MAG: DUF2723 domain-containing protein [Sandaracinaceae bacterium]|nr:DUF2723 domain-containing protein [Sandaracinaceae bacterium]